MATETSALIILTVANVVAGIISATSPTPPPTEEQQAAYSGNNQDVGTRYHLVSRFTTYWKIMVYLLSVIQLYVVLSIRVPSLGLPILPTPIIPALDALRPTLPFMLGSLALYLGASLRYWCFQTLGKYFTFNLSVFNDHKLITSGPYNIVRHPSYVGTALQYLGMAQVLVGSSGSGWVECGIWGTWIGKAVALPWLLISTIMLIGCLQRVPKEDRIMREKFGSTWDEWAKRTPYKLIPYIY